jgi:hypothetical protein
MPLSALWAIVCTQQITARCDEWVDRIVQWKELGLQSVWFFMHQHDERYSPELCDYVIDKLNQRLGTSL